MDFKRIKPALSIGLFIFALAAFLAIWNPLEILHWKTSDMFFRGRVPSQQITIIAIDDKSLSQQANLGRFKDWPRSYYAQLLNVIAPHKPAVVAFDLDFKEESRGMSDLRLKQLLREHERRVANSSGSAGLKWYEILKRFEEKGGHPDDSDFQDALNQSGPVVLVSTLLFDKEVAAVEKGFPEPKSATTPIFKGSNVSVGYVNIFPDRDGVIRRFLPWAGALSSFPAAIVQSFRPSSLPVRQAGLDFRPLPLLINYSARPFSFRAVSFVDALAGNFAPSDISEKIVLVGATSAVLQDMRATPTSRNPMPGVEINANIVQQLLEARPLNEQSLPGLLIMLFLLSLCGAGAMLVLPLRTAGAVFAVVLLGLPAIAFGMYQQGIVLNVVYAEITWIFIGIASLWYRNKTELRAKRQIKKAFAHYVSPIVVNELARDPAMLKLGGKRQKISIMFSDIAGFTTLAEKLTPEDTVALLNDYLTAMTEAIFAYHGTLDKYQGDAIMALFGAPLPSEHHALNACQTALGMRRALVALHEKWNAIPNLPFKDELIQLEFRVGISTGDAVIGNVGSKKRFDYTAIGDVVNLGSRLESLNKKYGTRILVDKETFTAVTENHNPFVFRKLDTVRVKGKKHETEVFELLAFAETLTDEMKGGLDDFENGRVLYTQRNFAEAKQYFESALSKMKEDGPAQIYRNRCNFFLRKPPNRDWLPIVDLEEK